MRIVRKLFTLIASALCLALMFGMTLPANAQVRAALTRDMDSPIRGTRFVQEDTVNFDTGAFSVTTTISPVIPAGKKLFLQAVSMHTLLTDGQSLMEARVTIVPASARFWVSQTFQATATGSSNPQRHFTGNQEVNMTLSPGETISIFLFRNDNQGSASLNFSRVSVIGYLVDTNP